MGCYRIVLMKVIVFYVIIKNIESIYKFERLIGNIDYVERWLIGYVFFFG